jgi:hypothetical protein
MPSHTDPVGRQVESSMSFLLENCAKIPLPITIVLECVQENDACIQIYPVNRDLSQDGRNRDVSYGDQVFDENLKKKCKFTVVPPRGRVRVDYFSFLEPHPCLSSNRSFQIEPEDKEVNIRWEVFFNQPHATLRIWVGRVFIGVLAIAVVPIILSYLWVKFGSPVWGYFSRASCWFSKR